MLVDIDDDGGPGCDLARALQCELPASAQGVPDANPRLRRVPDHAGNITRPTPPKRPLSPAWVAGSFVYPPNWDGLRREIGRCHGTQGSGILRGGW